MNCGTLSRDFNLIVSEDSSSSIDVTSVDITTDGCYVVVGCSNGVVLLFDMSAPTNTNYGSSK